MEAMVLRNRLLRSGFSLSSVFCLILLGCAPAQVARKTEWRDEAIFLIDPVTYGIVTVQSGQCEIVIYKPDDRETTSPPLPAGRRAQFASVAGNIIGLSTAISSGQSVTPILLIREGSQWTRTIAPDVPEGFFALAGFASPDGSVHIVGCDSREGLMDLTIRDGKILSRMLVTALRGHPSSWLSQYQVMPTAEGCLAVKCSGDFATGQVSAIVYSFASGKWNRRDFAVGIGPRNAWAWDVSENGRTVHVLEWDCGQKATLHALEDAEGNSTRAFDLRILRPPHGASPVSVSDGDLWVAENGDIYFVGCCVKPGLMRYASIGFYRMNARGIVEVAPTLETFPQWDDPLSVMSVLPQGTFSRPNGHPWPRARDLFSLLGPRELVEKTK
jgi:hypothetical protein